MASKDLSGLDVPVIQRYPGAVRVKYKSHLLGNERVSEVGYLAGDGIGDAQEFYEPRTPLASWAIQPATGKGEATKFSVTKKGLDASIKVATRHTWEGNNPG